jgi:hypothetical protein
MNYFITQEELKVNSPVAPNVNIQDIWPNVRVGSDFALEPVLGSYFYNHLLMAYNANPQTLTPAEQVLLPYLKMVNYWSVASESVYSLHFKLKAIGVQVQNSDNSDAADSNDVKFLKRHYDQKKEFYIERLKHFLKTNKADYPELTNKLNTNCDADFRPNNERGDSYNDDMLMI